jgi:hypothetical protein
MQNITIHVNDIIKYSLNTALSTNFRGRKKYKDSIISSIEKSITDLNINIINNPCDIEFHFIWKDRKLDVDNCVIMSKIMQDKLFKQDNIIKSIKLTSKVDKNKNINSCIINIIY